MAPTDDTTGSAVPAYLAPKQPRRGYAERARVGTPAMAATPRVFAAPSVASTIQAMLDAHTLDWAPTQLDNCRGYLASPTGRFQAWCRAEGIVTMDDLTTERLLRFMSALADRCHGPGLKPATIAKLRSHLRALAHFQATTPGYGTSLADIDRIPKPRMPKERIARALGRDDEQRLLAACPTRRDRLILELFLATGVRVSEMAALRIPSLLFSARPPCIVVSGSIHDPDESAAVRVAVGCRPRQVRRPRGVGRCWSEPDGRRERESAR